MDIKHEQGKVCKLEIEAGAMCNVMSLKTLRALQFFKMHKIGNSKEHIKGKIGQPLKAYGKIAMAYAIKNKEVEKDVEFQVLHTISGINLLRRNQIA